MFIEALLTIPKTWKQPMCLLTDEWIKKIIYVCVCVEYYSTIKKKGILPFVTTMCMNITYYVYRNKSDRERQIVHDLTYMWDIKMLDSSTECRMLLVRGWG